MFDSVGGAVSFFTDLWSCLPVSIRALALLSFGLLFVSAILDLLWGIK